MSITKVKRLEKLFKKTIGEQDEIIVPLLSTPEQYEALKEKAKREGKKLWGIPIAQEIAEKNEINLYPINNRL